MLVNQFCLGLLAAKLVKDAILKLDIVIADNRKLGHELKLSHRIPQLDGPIPDQYDEAVSTPNIYNYQGVVNEDYNVASTPAPPELQAPTPAMVNQNDVLDDDEDEPLNENDDDDDLDDVDQGEELSTHHLVLAQFDKVTRAKSRWKCTLKDGIMHINNKDVLFNKKFGTDTANHSIINTPSWEEVTEGRKKGRLYGFGLATDPLLVLTGSISTNAASSAGFFTYQVSALQEEIQELRRRDETRQQEMERRDEERQQEMERREAEREEARRLEREAFERQITELREIVTKSLPPRHPHPPH